MKKGQFKNKTYDTNFDIELNKQSKYTPIELIHSYDFLINL